MMVFVRASLDDREIVYCCGQTQKMAVSFLFGSLGNSERGGGNITSTHEKY
jgi:hypothetical protein